MSLRLDPKYHGVRVARVRPKFKVLSGPQMEKFHRGYKAVRFWRIQRDIVFRFVKGYDKYRRKVQWVASPDIAAIIGHDCFSTQKEALEALGLR